MCITCGLAAAFLAACGGLIGDSPIITHYSKFFNEKFSDLATIKKGL